MTPAEVLSAIAPAYGSNPASAVYLELAAERTSGTFFGTRYSHAVALRAAHMMAVNLDPLRANGVAGTITQKQEGDLSISFGAGNAGTITDADLAQTSYGRQLDALIKGSGAFVGVSGNVLHTGGTYE